MEYLVLAVLILVFGAFLILFVKEELKLKVCTILTFLSSATALFPAGFVLYKGGVLDTSIPLSSIFGTAICSMDSLSAVFVLIIAIMSFLGVIYTNGYIKPYLNKRKNIGAHCFFLMFLIASMYSVVVARHGLFFLVVWEIMSLSSFFLVLFEGDKKEVRKAGIKYLVYMHLSVIFIILT